MKTINLSKVLKKDLIKIIMALLSSGAIRERGIEAIGKIKGVRVLEEVG